MVEEGKKGREVIQVILMNGSLPTYSADLET